MSGITNPVVELKKETDHQIIKIKGKMIYGKTANIKDTITNYLHVENKVYIFDFTELEYIDSTGFGLVINFAKQVNEIEGHIIIIVKDDFLYNLFKIAKLNLVFPICRTYEEAKIILKEKYNSEIKIDEY